MRASRQSPAPLVLVAALALAPGSANRINFDARGGDPGWKLRFAGVPCYLVDLATQLGPLAKGLVDGFGDGENLARRLGQVGRDIAKKDNCRLCDFFFEGSTFPKLLGDTQPWVRGKAQCAAAEGKYLGAACFSDHGPVGKFSGAPSRGLCTPCPKECDAGCDTAGWTDMGKSGDTDFKCKTTVPAALAKAATYGADAVLPAGFTCEVQEFGEAGGDLQEALNIASGLQDASSLVPKLSKRKDFKTSGEWKLWCKFKEDHAEGVRESVKSPNAVEGSSWVLDSGLTSCDHEKGPNQDLLSRLEAQVSPALISLARDKNCAVCGLNFGGSIEAIKATKAMDEAFEDFAMLGPEVGTARPSSGLWGKSECFSALGDDACNRGHGPVGWASDSARCLPCPKECIKCIEISGEGKFKCTLAPLVAFPSPALLALTGASPSVSKEALYRVPTDHHGARLQCEEPLPRDCGKSVVEWCKDWQFKIVCDIPEAFIAN